LFSRTIPEPDEVLKGSLGWIDLYRRLRLPLSNVGFRSSAILSGASGLRRQFETDTSRVIAKDEAVGCASSAPRVHVVVLNWNSPQMTADCLRSLLATSAGSFRIVVVDNGSRDNSVGYLRGAFPEVEVIANDRNLGFAGGCNVGIRHALAEGADYILLANNDTIVDPGLLPELMAHAEAHPEAGILSPKIYYADPSDALWWAGGVFNIWTGLAAHVDRQKKDTGNHDLPRVLDWATGCVMLLRCEALRRTGLFDELIFATGEDVDLSLRTIKAGYVVKYVPAARVWHREGVDLRKNAGQHVRNFLMVRNHLWVMHKHAQNYHWIIFWPFFFSFYLPKMMILNLGRGDLRSCKAVLQGVVAFWKMLLNPGISVLPAELKGAAARTVPRDEIAAN
jgi:GT2 family glycosyltransferase